VFLLPVFLPQPGLVQGAPDAEDIPLKCDVCGEPMPEGGPLCVQWCLNDSLTYEPERQEEIEAKEEGEEEGVEEL